MKEVVTLLRLSGIGGRSSDKSGRTGSSRKSTENDCLHLRKALIQMYLRSVEIRPSHGLGSHKHADAGDGE